MMLANAIALSKCIKRPCMVYEDPLKKADISDVKLSDIIDDMKKTKECPIFDGTTEIEGLLYTEERFRKIARQLQFNTGVELYDNFEEVLRETAEEHWVQITANVAAGARTPATFNNHVEELYTKYVDADARNQMFKYIPHLRKPRSTLEDFGPTFKYIEGKENVLADCFSRLPRMPKILEGEKSAIDSALETRKRGKVVRFQELQPPIDHDDQFHNDMNQFNQHMPCKFACCREDPDALPYVNPLDDEVIESFLNLPELTEMQNPITIHNIQQHQFEDEALNNKRLREPNKFPIQYIQNRPIICVGTQTDWRIALPTQLIHSAIRWYHRVLGHCGKDRLYTTMANRFFVPGLKAEIDNYSCDECQRYKIAGAGYGQLPPREAQLSPWDEVAVDLIGPWKIDLPNGESTEILALTCIDTVTNLVELIRIRNKSAEHVSQQFRDVWLTRYPRPNRCVHDNGGEFIGEKFQLLLQQWGIKDVAITSHNPQANSICERMHQTVGNILRTMLHTLNPQTTEDAEYIVDHALAATMHATRCAVNRMFQESPGALAFQRDMILDIPIIADLQGIQLKRQMQIDNNLMRQNSKRRDFDFRIGQPILGGGDEDRMCVKGGGWVFRCC